MVTHVDQTWKPLLDDLERIDAALDELQIEEER
jgi:hypothetical protein